LFHSSFQLGDDVILEMTEKDNRIRLEMKDICVSATCDQYGQGHIDIVRYSKENAAVQKVCFNGRKIRVKQNQYSASISAKNELSLGNWSAEHIPNKGEIFNRTVKNELK
jgi:hypothetical protein